ncbi:hypothetical protein HYT25_02400 [Candidatus Pacearchaeota archaeon]|nr:hypothetical protein [Candidatus Pacearchaeota archaeon]
MKRGSQVHPSSSRTTSWRSSLARKRKGLLKNRRGISVMIGYILLISMAILMSIIVYQWVKTYVPQESIKCDEGVSLFIQSYNNDCSDDRFDLTLKNNGRFDIAGYFIHATTSSDQELAVNDLSSYNTNPKRKVGGFVKYWTGGNDINPKSAGDTLSDSFAIGPLSVNGGTCSSSSGQCIYSIEIVPLRYETIKNRIRPVSCTDARIKENLICGTFGISCNLNNNIEGTEQCDGTDLDGKNCETAFESGWTGTLSCTSSCTFTGCTAPPPAAVCGDGTVNQESEQCDNDVGSPPLSGDGCSSSCQVETLNIVALKYPSLKVFGFEDNTIVNQGWTISGNVNRNTVESPTINVTDAGQKGGIANIRIRGGTASISQNFNLVGYTTVTVNWSGYYNSFEGSDCLQFKVGTSVINSWCSSTTQDGWIPQNVILTDTSSFTSSTQFSFVGGMNSDGDKFYIDGINISGVKY